MVEHKEWVGLQYGDGKPGIKGQRIAIVGHSHYSGDGNDGDNATICILSRVISGKWSGRSFFSPVRNYFDYSDHKDFWPRVLFFNYLSEFVGTARDRYKCGTKDQIERAQARFLRLIGKHQPHKVLVFTNSPGKGWQEFPPTLEEAASPSGVCRQLGATHPAGFTWGTYDAGGWKVAAFGLRHPQGANGEVMRAAVREILSRKPIP